LPSTTIIAIPLRALSLAQDRIIFIICLNMAAQLPYELVEEIITSLSGDRTSLRACSLVCRGWAMMCQRHIFYTITVHTGQRSHPIAFLRAHPHLCSLAVNLEWYNLQSCSPDDVKFLFPNVRHLFCYVPIVDWIFVSSFLMLETLEIGPSVQSVIFKGTSSDISSTTAKQIAVRNLYIHTDWYEALLQNVLIKVRADVLRVLELSLPQAAQGNLPWFRQFLTSLTALDEMRLSISQYLWQAG
jgi:hypothetical protein